MFGERGLRVAMMFLIIAAVAWIALNMYQRANAGISGGFAPYAKQGIVNELNHIYGKGNSPYKVRCSEVDLINYRTGEIRDTVTCIITGPLSPTERETMHVLLALYFLIHVVKPGDTLWGMVGNHYPAVCQENHIRNCDLIYPGQKVRFPKEWERSGVRTSGFVRRSADNDGPARNTYTRSGLSGNLGCTGLAQLWDANGGNPSSAFVAAEIAMAESGGRQYATGPAGERGYWQINPVNGYLSTYNPNGNARAAIVLSGNGRDWSPWTTFTSGTYRGRC